MKPFILIIIFGIFVSSCSHCQLLTVTEHYTTPNQLASLQAGTPDPRKCCPPLGQHITVFWNIGSRFICFDEWWIRLRIRLRDGSEKQLIRPISYRLGSDTFSLMNEEYLCGGGIAFYRIELYADGQIIDQWNHLLWSEWIDLDQTLDQTCEEELNPAD